MATHKATIAGLQNDRQYGVRAFVRSPNGWQTAPDAFGFCTPMAFSRILAENSWAQIDAASRAGLAPTLWKVGDEKNITLTTGELLTLQIYGFNHDDLTGGGKAGITFGLKRPMAQTRTMDPNKYIVGYRPTAMLSWVSGTLYSQLPPEVRAVIKAVNKQYSTGGTNPSIETFSSMLDLFTDFELTGYAGSAKEGTRYSIFTNNASLAKGRQYWTRTPDGGQWGGFGYVQPDGSHQQAAEPGTNSLGVCFGFCV